jgi:hypothetical protein
MTKQRARNAAFNPRRAWLILVGLMIAVSITSASATVWLVKRQPGSSGGTADPLSLAEHEGTFQSMKATLRWPSLNFGIEGSALVIEGTADNEAQIHEVLTLVKHSIKADSFYIVHPYIERPDWITGRVEAMREGKWNYERPNGSVLIVNLLKTAPPKKDPL